MIVQPARGYDIGDATIAVETGRCVIIEAAQMHKQTTVGEFMSVWHALKYPYISGSAFKAIFGRAPA